ncbi:hypothetical protein [Prescottella agglutinans]|uniref:Uncharacterized protein n=1 Tax=Prescottella agglutinans TaxID=1644129 RepID=A0ABT6MJC3_9NOCA|nr:hypothetical protein [Prescottella agglutinans]MDH6283896.1 hypothetical protein [Prescottella agglutinans]
MPKRDTIVLLTSDEAETITASINADHSKVAIKLLNQKLSENNGTLKALRSGPQSAEAFTSAAAAARENLALLGGLPACEERDALTGDLERALQIIEDGLEMHVRANG